jgi:predicted nucleotidyltransferase
MRVANAGAATYNRGMGEADIIAKLKAIEPDLRAGGVAALFVFGSHATGVARPDSDVDVFIDPSDPTKFGLREFIGAYEILRAALGRPIDYGTREGLSKYIRGQVEHEAVQVF